MFKKCTIVTLAAAIMAFVFFSPVSVATDEQVIQGTGAFWAKGAGVVHLEGKDFVGLEGFGKGVLAIMNVSKTKIKIKGMGKIIHLPKDDVLLILGLKGKVLMTGNKLVMHFKDGPIILNAKGKGTVWLKGKGLFKIDQNQAQKWPLKFKKFTY